MENNDAKTRNRPLGWVIAGAGVVVFGVGAVLFVQASSTNTAEDNTYREAQSQASEVFDSGGTQDSPIAVPDLPPSDTPPVITGPFPEGDGALIARLDFVRPGSDERPVSDEPIYVRDGVSDPVLALGPGRYPNTDVIGGIENTAIAGHRTGFGSPFLRLDELQPGDDVLVTNPDGDQWTYRVQGSEIVDPDAAWVLGPDPLELGKATLTLTTCDPPNSDVKRLVVFAERIDG